jgi:hypothetical protein
MEEPNITKFTRSGWKGKKLGLAERRPSQPARTCRELHLTKQNIPKHRAVKTSVSPAKILRVKKRKFFGCI